MTSLIRRSETGSNNTSQPAVNNASKPAVIAIAIAATVLFVALCGGCLLICLVRRRHRRERTVRNHAESSNGASSLHECLSKTPLVRQENASHAHGNHENHENQVPQYHDDLPLNRSMLHQSISGCPLTSPPPAYASIVQAVPDTGSQNIASGNSSLFRSHQPLSSTDRLPTLMSTSSQHGHEISSRWSSENSELRPAIPRPSNSNGSLTAVSQERTGRPRTASRFREEDLDT